MGIKVVQLNVLLELQLKNLLVISIYQYNQLTPGWTKVTFGGCHPLGPPLNPLMKAIKILHSL